MERLGHVDSGGRARMVDVTEKSPTRRDAVARAAVRMNPQTLEILLGGGLPKGDVLAAARLAGIMAAKRTPWLIPLCHPLSLSLVEIMFRRGGDGLLEIEARAAATARTGVEMEAMTAAAVCALTVYDMCKGVDRWAVIDDIRLVSKSGGKSGTVRREGEAEWRERL